MPDQTRLEAIFSAARNIPTGYERDAYVNDACGRDSQLLQRVQDLLQSHEQSDGPLDAPPPGLSSVPTGSSVYHLAGTQIGRYKIREQIGEGGFGVVYVAEQQKPIRRKVALKIIKPGMDTKDVIARFEAEQQALALMDHPNVAKVLDAGCTETGRPYFVMELIHGLKITEFCDKNRLSTQQRVELFIDVCGAVQHAHHKAIIHRDIKPSNILVTLHDGKPIPKVIDFGVAKALSQQLTEKTIYTNYGQMLGTPEYMSPEQAEMTGLDIDTRCDIYSLGVVLYELLVGRPPFEAERLRASGFEGILRVIREDEPPTPSRKLSAMGVEASAIADRRRTDVSRLRQSLRGDLDWIVMKAIEKDRHRRYKTANGLALDLKRHLDSEPVIARPQTVAYRLQKMWRRNRLVLSAVGAVAIALLLGTGISVWQAVKATDAKTQAVRAQAAERRQRIAAVASERQMQRIAETRRQELYAAQVSLAHQAWLDGDLARAQTLLAALRPAPNQTDLRGFEWRYLWELCQDESQRTLRAYSGDTVSWNSFDRISLSADGGKLAIAEEKVIRVWDFANRRELPTVDPHVNQITAVVFSPIDPDLLAVGDGDGTITLWNLTTSAPSSVLSKDKPVNLQDASEGMTRKLIRSLAFSPEGEKIVSASEDGYLTRWDVETGTPDWSVPGHWDTNVLSGEEREPALCVAYSPDGKYVASGGGDTKVKLWNSATGELFGSPLEGHTAFVVSLEFSPDGQLLASGGFDGRVLLWGVTTREAGNPRPLLGHRGIVKSVAFSPDGKTLASGGDDSTIRCWSTLTATQTSILRGHTGSIHSVAFSPDGQSLVSAGKTAKLWRAPPHRSRDVLTEHSGWVWGVAFSPDGKTLITSDHHTLGLKIWDTPSRRHLRDLLGHTGAPHDLAISPNGLFLASGGADRMVRLWDLSKYEEVRAHKCDSVIGTVSFSSDSRYLRAISGSVLKSWSIASGREIESLKRDSRSMHHAVFSPDDRLLAAHDEAGKVSVWQTDDWKEVAHFNWNNIKGNDIRSLTFSSDGHIIAVVGVQGIALFDIGKQEILQQLHGTGILAIAFTPDSKTLASVGWDSTIRLWNVASGRVALTLQQQGPVADVAFSNDGRLMATCGADATARLWPAASLSKADASLRTEAVDESR